jgi:hypothetical protein
MESERLDDILGKGNSMRGEPSTFRPEGIMILSWTGKVGKGTARQDMFYCWFVE